MVNFGKDGKDDRPGKYWALGKVRQRRNALLSLLMGQK